MPESLTPNPIERKDSEMTVSLLENGEPITELAVDDNPDLVTCRDCSDERPADEMNDHDGDNVCDSCHGDYVTCAGCDDMTHVDETYVVQGGDHVCDSCSSNYYACDRCEEMVHTYNTVGIGYDGTACEHCRDYYASYCEGCGEYRWDDDEPCCDSRDCECSPPTAAQSFTFPASRGTATVDNDERVEITLEAGVISGEGVRRIGNVIRKHFDAAWREVRNSDDTEQVDAVRTEYVNAYALTERFEDEVGTKWQGERGNFTKRLSRFAYNEYKLRLPADMLSEVGNIARANSDGTSVSVEMTRDLNQSASDFFHEDSCWWTDYSESRCSLKNNGGIGMRTFGDVTYPLYGYQHGPWKHDFGRAYVEIGKTTNRNVVTGRAWVMPVNYGEPVEQRSYDYNAGEWTTKPVRHWTPTFDTTSPDGYVVFNGYGDLDNATPARILAEMIGGTYRKIDFDCDPMYVNAGGYLVTTDEVAATLGDLDSITIHADSHANLYSRELTNA